MKKIELNNNFFDIVKWNLVKYFGYQDRDIDDIITDFKNSNMKKNDNFYMRYGSYHTASMIYHYDKKIDTKWNDWRDQNNYVKPPQEAIDYYNAYFTSNKY